MDLARMAGCQPVGVLCEVVADDGSMARAPALQVRGAAASAKQGRASALCSEVSSAVRYVVGEWSPGVYLCRSLPSSTAFPCCSSQTSSATGTPLPHRLCHAPAPTH